MKIKFKNKTYKNIIITSTEICFGKYYTVKDDDRSISPMTIQTSMSHRENTLIERYRYNFKILNFKALVDLGIIEIEKKKHSRKGTLILKNQPIKKI